MTGVEEIFYTPTRSIKVFKNNLGNSYREYWYIHSQNLEVELFLLDDEKGFTTLENIKKYILKTIYKETSKINKQILLEMEKDMI